MGPRTFFVLGLAITSIVAQGGLTVKILNGTIQGGKCSGADVNYFLSIPYAKPPIDDLRFAAPQLFDESFSGTRDATLAAPACPQFNTVFAETNTQSEDCLYIDVWAHANASSSSNLPVRVWLYGGGNAAGGISNPAYDGCGASTQTIQVSINYRLGPLGFLALESLGLTGNYGIQDQLLGLRWVQDNIAAFGGDPRKVMLHGQSAGGTDTIIQATLPSAPSLFRSAIVQSGNGYISTMSNAKSGNEAFVEGLKCSLTDVTCIRKAGIPAMRATFLSLANSLGLGGSLGPVIDGNIIPVQPLTGGLKVPTIIGSTTNEGTLFFLAAYRESVLTLNPSVYDSYLNAQYGASTAQSINQSYPISKYTVAPVFNALSNVVTVSIFRCSARRALRSASANVPVWTYSFGAAPSCPWYPSVPADSLFLLGATHTAEIPFIFGQLDSLPRPSGKCSLTAAERTLSTTMRAAWDSMAATGNPGTGWPAWSANTSLGVNVVGDAWVPGVVDYSMCDFWDKIAAAQQAAAGDGSSTNDSSGSTATSSASGTTATAGTNDGAPPGLRPWLVFAVVVTVPSARWLL